MSIKRPLVEENVHSPGYDKRLDDLLLNCELLFNAQCEHKIVIFVTVTEIDVQRERL